MAVTEYGAGGAVSLHSDNALGGPESRNRPQAEEYESYIHEQNWSTMRSKPYLWGTFLWNSFDFGSTTRSEGNAQDINTKGIVTFDHKYQEGPVLLLQSQLDGDANGPHQLQPLHRASLPDSRCAGVQQRAQDFTEGEWKADRSACRLPGSHLCLEWRRPEPRREQHHCNWLLPQGRCGG